MGLRRCDYKEVEGVFLLYWIGLSSMYCVVYEIVCYSDLNDTVFKL
jgi:hypothetical protein